jgi:hypothetical protein
MTGIEPLGLMLLPPQLTAPGTTAEQGATLEFQASWTTEYCDTLAGVALIVTAGGGTVTVSRA